MTQALRFRILSTLTLLVIAGPALAGLAPTPVLPPATAAEAAPATGGGTAAPMADFTVRWPAGGATAPLPEPQAAASAPWSYLPLGPSAPERVVNSPGPVPASSPLFTPLFYPYEPVEDYVFAALD